MIKTLLSAAAIAGFMAGTASAITVLPETNTDRTFVESDGNRPLSSGDIPAGDILDAGVVDLGETVGIAGRIRTSIDTWRFVTVSAWEMALVNLPLDDNQGFDSSQIVNPAGSYAPNGDPTSATFSLYDDSFTLIDSVFLTADPHGLVTGLDFTGNSGTFFLEIAGASGSVGATYDIAISAIPLPAAGWLLISALGSVAFLGHRRQTV